MSHRECLDPVVLETTYEVYDLGDMPDVPYAMSTDLNMARGYLRTCTGQGVVVRVTREVVPDTGTHTDADADANADTDPKTPDLLKKDTLVRSFKPVVFKLPDGKLSLPMSCVGVVVHDESPLTDPPMSMFPPRPRSPRSVWVRFEVGPPGYCLFTIEKSVWVSDLEVVFSPPWKPA